MHKFVALKLYCYYKTDQVPFYIVLGIVKTWDEKGQNVVMLAQPQGGLDKIKCATKPRFHPRFSLPHIGMVFRGTGKYVHKNRYF